jgi:hypothetical protein
VLACLVAADRYNHLDTEIRPERTSGRTVICDRYLASTLVLQARDGLTVPTCWRCSGPPRRPLPASACPSSRSTPAPTGAARGGADSRSAGTRAIGMPSAARVSTDSARGRETTGTNRHEPGNPGMRTGRPTRESGLPFKARRLRETAGQRPNITLKQLPRHHHPLHLIRPLVDLGDRGPAGSFRS